MQELLKITKKNPTLILLLMQLNLIRLSNLNKKDNNNK